MFTYLTKICKRVDRFKKKTMLEDRELCSVKEKEVYVQKVGLELQISMHT